MPALFSAVSQNLYRTAWEAVRKLNPKTTQPQYRQENIHKLQDYVVMKSDERVFGQPDR